ncbi:hypothetical protein [Paraburkholderia pallida]|uniref:hypothetical protein n=1 Tax=Paraburkholderia pallida TaxID=2547399 RepID=UPI00142FC1C6|nr:hypothetical protein [Paraburkholderia pallida]
MQQASNYFFGGRRKVEYRKPVTAVEIDLYRDIKHRTRDLDFGVLPDRSINAVSLFFLRAKAQR